MIYDRERAIIRNVLAANTPVMTLDAIERLAEKIANALNDESPATIATDPGPQPPTARVDLTAGPRLYYLTTMEHGVLVELRDAAQVRAQLPDERERRILLALVGLAQDELAADV